MKDVLFIVPYPLHRAPSQRFRVELYEPLLRDNHVSYDIFPFMDEATWNVIYKQTSAVSKISGMLKGYRNRWRSLSRIRRYQFIFIHREAAPLGPPLFEWIIAKVLKKKVVYDFDDAIWIPNTSRVNKMASWFKAFWKVKYICKWSYKVAAGNDYLCRYAKQYNNNVELLPTCVDAVRGHYKVRQHYAHKPVLGWTGSHSTLFYLDDIVPVLRELQEEIDFSFLVIADKNPELDLKDWQFVPWNEKTEQEDLLRMDAGIMPLKADAWSEGKCGFKLIQYMALGIPPVASPVGVNKKIVDDGVNGFLCETKEEWKMKLKMLLTDESLRNKFGERGREKIVSEYSIQSQQQRFLSLFK
ncbi:MAG TPA: glycosyltransferase [Flavipsychrobacter sp.]|nr:glycosyltransferase [Flavipsychrobacter sp.]